MSGFDDEPVFEKATGLTDKDRARIAELAKKGWPKEELTTGERIELEDLKFRLGL